jgi:hypothetical protein
MAGGRERDGSPEKSHRWGSVVLENDGEVVLAFVVPRDGVDGVQKIAANLQVRSSVSIVSCNGDGAWLDVSVLTVVSRAWRGAVWTEGS